MKKLLLFILMCAPGVVSAQRMSRAYLGAQLHDFKTPGGSFVYSFAVNKYLGIGPGLDAGSYEAKTATAKEVTTGVISFYGDIRGKIEVGNLMPFVYAQGGYFKYQQDGQFVNQTATYTDITSKGRYFYGGGIGVAFKKGLVGVFVSYTQRLYHFKYEPEDANINGRPIKSLVDNNDSIGILTAGVIF